MLYKNILLIDDDEDDQEIFLTALEKLAPSLTCKTLENARKALDMMHTGQLDPDIIFLDWNMPIMNGQQFLTEIKKVDNLKDIPIIILSTSSHNITMQTAKQLGADDFITKPDNFDNLMGLLRSVLK